MTKVYISLPIIGREIDSVHSDCERTKQNLLKSGFTPISPLELYNGNDTPYPEHTKNIQTLLEYHTVYFVHGWENAQG